MKKLISIWYILVEFLIINCSLLNINAQQPILEWSTLFPGRANFWASSPHFVSDENGNIYVTGSVGTSNTSGYCTFKYNSSGVIQWTSFYYGQNSGGKFPHAIALDRYRNVYVTGYSYQNGSYFDYCTIKYDTAGAQQWIKFYDGPRHDIDQAEEIALDDAGNIYVSGFSRVTGGSFAYTTIKYTQSGDEIWVRTYPEIGDVHVAGIKIDNNCNIYIGGSYGFKSVTVKYDSSGNTLWAKEYNGPGIERQTGANGIAMDSANNVYITGLRQGIITQEDCFTIKYSSEGIEQWVRRFNLDSTVYSDYEGKSIVLDKLGNSYISVLSRANQGARMIRYLVKYSGNGELLWAQIDSDTVSSEGIYTCIDKNNNIYVTFCSGSYAPPRYTKTKKHNANGSILWEIIYNRNTVHNNGPSGILTNGYGNVFVCGDDLSNQHGDIYVLKYSQPVGIINTQEIIPNNFTLYQNFPNPFNSSTVFEFEIIKNEMYKFEIYDILGRKINELFNKKINTGKYKISFDAQNLASGTYFYKLSSNKYILTKKFILIK
jgi:hypothetical protein